MTARPWSPPALGRDALRAGRWASLAPWLPLAADDWDLAVAPVPPAQVEPPMPALGLQWNEHRYRIALPAACLREAGAPLAVALDEATLPGDLRALLLETATAAVLARLEQAAGGAWQWLDAPPAASATGFWARLRRGAASWPIRIEGDEAAMAALFAGWPVRRHEGPDALVFALRIRRGQTTLPWRVAASLRPGDVVLMQQTPAGGPLLVVAESRLAPLREHPDGWLLAAAPAAPDPKQSEWLMESNDMQAVGVDDPEHLPVRLSFDVGALTLSLAELRRLAPGQVLETGRALPEVVEIYAQGARIGRGELVEIEGRLGVSIVEVFKLRGTAAGAPAE
jgi:type III secretion protein Q